MKKFYINLDSAPERKCFFDDSYTRWSATSRAEITHLQNKKMISYYNISPDEHLAKCACLASHSNIWRYIATNKIDNVLIVEDDAKLVNPFPEELPSDGITYLGGFFVNPKITDKSPVNAEKNEGINKLDKGTLRMLMTLAYYIPHHGIAKEMIDTLDCFERHRAIDSLLYKIPVKNYYQYPAVFIERDLPSQIRKGKNKHSNDKYEWTTK